MVWVWLEEEALVLLVVVVVVVVWWTLLNGPEVWNQYHWNRNRYSSDKLYVALPWIHNYSMSFNFRG